MLNAAVVIRSASEKDLEVILDIYNEAILNTTAVYNEAPHTITMRRSWFDDKLKDGFPVFVAEHNGQVVGFSNFGHFRTGFCYQYTVENSVYIATGMRGQGIGKLLLPPLFDAARKMNIHAIIAGIDSSNQASIKLHQSFGFETVAHFKQVGFKFGKWLDLYFLELVL